MILTTYNGSDLWLVVAPPNYATAPLKVNAMLPFTDVQRAISARESRRAFGLTRKHSLIYTPALNNAFLANQFRSGLNSLKTELVGVPLWGDLCVTSAALSGTGATVALANLPARWGRAWVFLAPDGFTFEIVQVNSIDSGGALHFAARTGFAWPKESKVYPLLFGRFGERPKFNALTPSYAKGELSLLENSPVAEAITAYDDGTDLPTVGSHVPAFSTYRLWTMQPQLAEMLDSTEADTIYQSIGFGRQDAVYDFPNWNRRALEMQFDCRSRAEIAWVERMFADRVGSLKPFFIPTFRNDLELAADIAGGDDHFTIKDSAYELPEYDQIPGSAFIAIVNADGTPHPHRVIEVDGTTVTVQTAFSGAVTAATTRLSFLLLVRLAESKLAWDYITPSRARVRIQFVEVADEYVTPNPSQFQEAKFFHFEEVLPNGSENEWFYTSYEQAITVAGDTYSPAPLSHGAPTKTLNLADKCQLTTWGNPPLQPFNRFLPYTLSAEIKVTLAKGNLDGTGFRIIWAGVIKQLNTKGSQWTVDCGMSSLYDTEIPRFNFQGTDNLTQYSPATQLDADDWKETGTIASIDGMTITVSGVSNPDDWFSLGYLDTGAGGHAEGRSILVSSVSGSVQTLTIDRPLFWAVVGQSIDLFAGYDQTREQCDGKFNNNLNFGGHPFRPATNPTFKTNDIETPSGGKK